MRKIMFNEVTINEIRSFIEAGHTIQETCNRFTLKEDTLRRVMYENNIKAYHKEKASNIRTVTIDDELLLCKLYSTTHMSVKDIVKEMKLPYYQVLDILKKHFSEEYISKRKSKLYRLSKTGSKNPMTQMSGEAHFAYQEFVEDGNGYLMMHKPDWYTGRQGSEHVFVHTIVMCLALGLTELPKGYVVHHIDFDKMNNDISNLALMTISAHAKLHALMRDMCKVQRLSTTE